MRRYIPFGLIALSVLVIALGVVLLTQPDAPPADATAPSATGEVSRVSVRELQEQLQGSNPPQVWDVRGAEFYAAGHVPGARQVDLGSVEATAAGLDRNQPIVTLCS